MHDLILMLQRMEVTAGGPPRTVMPVFRPAAAGSGNHPKPGLRSLRLRCESRRPGVVARDGDSLAAMHLDHVSRERCRIGPARQRELLREGRGHWSARTRTSTAKLTPNTRQHDRWN